jgi:hypothetical protein
MQCYSVLFRIYNFKPRHSPHCPPYNIPGRIDAPHYEFIVNVFMDVRIAYSPDCSQRGPRLEFLTHWDGYDPTHDSWEPFANVEHVEALHDFAHSNSALARMFR